MMSKWNNNMLCHNSTSNHVEMEWYSLSVKIIKLLPSSKQITLKKKLHQN